MLCAGYGRGDERSGMLSVFCVLNNHQEET
jgi:hypothetical protein